MSFSYVNQVRRVHEDPRVTRPYTDEQWARIDALGEAVDERLTRGDVRLTMGGEPTFVARDDMTSAEWNTEADGPGKRALAATLAEQLRARYAGGGVVHRGQGKWYPGEPLPRWNIALQWRTDGVVLWRDPDLFVDPWDETAADPEAGAHAEALARRITQVLALPPEQLRPAFEDPFAAVADELRRPEGDPPEAAVVGLDQRGPGTPDARDLDGQVVEPTGWVLPLATGEEWRSPAWRLRRGRLVLTGGTSAVGLRLPLDAIAWKDPEFAGESSYLEAGPTLEPQVPTVRLCDPEGAPTTALAVEAREGFVHVFLPPTERLEDYCDLLKLVEVAARKLAVRIVLEGYGPPPDPRLTQLVVTPDPGVIEVNVQPTRSWAEQRELTTTLYDQARRAGLATEKFDLDGLHTGTGGGNHLTLGGHQPVDSPLLRRPDLLVSLLTYWQRHPALSYLFSGRFIGPTSQAPRFDEGRPEATYEMEIAFAEVARLTAQQSTGALDLDGAEDEARGPRPWLVDRALRHLLTDLTGNTHRAEFCVDKLYSPDSARGRLGLLELRGFEMPPHPQLALLQALLVRSLVAMFWERPLRAPLVRWGTALHEDFLLPHGAARDIAEVGADLRAFGIDVRGHLAGPVHRVPLPPHRRHPRRRHRRARAPAGRRAVARARRGGDRRRHRALRRLLGGAAAGRRSAGSTRSGTWSPARVCRCPSRPPVAPGELYAGVRFRAWQPWSALHPSIEVHSPLRIEVVDVPSAASLGGATYHVVHPGRPQLRAPAGERPRGRGPPCQPVRAVRAHRRPARRGRPAGGRAPRRLGGVPADPRPPAGVTAGPEVSPAPAMGRPT